MGNLVHGLFLDPRSWEIDFKVSSFWNPEKYGIKLDVHPGAFNIPKQGIGSQYKFVITSEIWELPMQKALYFLRDKGVKVFFAPREPLKTDALKDAMFSYARFFYNNSYYFKPDLILAPGQGYADMWKGKARSVITGYPRFDYYMDKTRWPNKKNVATKYGLNPNKKWIFFPSYPPYHYTKTKNQDDMIDLYDVREQTLAAILDFTTKNTDYQAVVKIHPSSMKPYLKGTGRGDEVSGLLKKYYKSPSESMAVVGDVRSSGTIAKSILVNADIVCGFTSTMLLEAAMIGKPALHVLFGCSADIPGIPEYIDHTTTAFNIKEMHSFFNNPSVIPNTMIEKYFYQIDGLSCKRMCEAIINNI